MGLNYTLTTRGAVHSLPARQAEPAATDRAPGARPRDGERPADRRKCQGGNA